MNIEREKRRCAPDAGRLYFSGGSSASENTTNNYDMRVVGGDGSTNVSTNVAEGGSVTITDGGAVAKAIDLAKSNTSATVGAQQQMFAGAVAAVDDANKRLALAY